MGDEPKTTVKLLRVPQRFETVNGVLETAIKMGLPNVLVIAELEDGATVLLESPDMTVASANYLLDKAKMVLLAPESFKRRDK